MSSPLWARCFTFFVSYPLSLYWFFIHFSALFFLFLLYFCWIYGAGTSPPFFLTMPQTLHARIWEREKKNPVVWCETFAEGNNKVLHLLTHNDRGEQERAQSRKREGLGETAPAPGVRPERTFKDWAGLCGDPRVSVGELCENGAQASRRSCTMDSIKSEPPHKKN